MEMSESRIEALDLNQQAVMLIKSGSLEKAKERLDKAIEIEPMLVDNYRNYGDLYMAAQSYKEAKIISKRLC